MITYDNLNVAVLLPTYNGAKFVGPQIASLRQNSVRFTLHWLDDHSSDNTREAVRAAAQRADINLREWHQTQHQGYPGSYFQLMECVEADIYLFCDQDDVWQPGKIDATVSELMTDIAAPVLCFSDPLIFFEEAPTVHRKLSDVLRLRPPAVLEETRTFVCIPGIGHTMGFTRPLRDLYLRDTEVARAYAYAHDWWMYFIAVASGTRRWLSEVPTTLYRQHGNNFTGFMYSSRRMSLAQLLKVQQRLRPLVARQAQGFIQASRTLPHGPNMQRLLALAEIFATIDRRQNLSTLLHLARRNALWPDSRTAMCFVAACLGSDAEAPNLSPHIRRDPVEPAPDRS